MAGQEGRAARVVGEDECPGVADVDQADVVVDCACAAVVAFFVRVVPRGTSASQTARLSSRWVRCGARSPACRAIIQPFRLGMPLTRALTYLPACSHGSHRTKHDLSSHSSSPRFRAARTAPILAAAAASGFVVVTNA